MQDLEEAAAYLNAALEEEELEVVLLALRNVVDAAVGVVSACGGDGEE